MPCSFDCTTRPPDVCRFSSLDRCSDVIWRAPCVPIPKSTIPQPSVRTAATIRAGSRSLVPRRRVYHVGIVPDDRSTRTSGLSVLVLTWRGDPFLVIAVKNERCNANHVIFHEVMKIFILLVEDRKVGLLRKIVKQVEQGQTRYADALLENVYATLLVEGKLPVSGLEKGNHIPIVVQEEKVSQNHHVVLAPGLLTTGVILIGNTHILQSTEESLFRWKSSVVDPLQTVHVLVREKAFRHLASVRFQILVVQRLQSRCQRMYVTSTMQGQTEEETHAVVGVPLAMVGFVFHADVGFVLLDVDWKGHAYTSYWMIDDAVDEEGDFGHEFAHPRRIRSLINSLLQDVGLSDAFEKDVKVLAVGDETGFVQVASTAIARGIIVLVSTRVFVPQNETVTEVNLERVGLFLEHYLQRSL